ncbi:MAG: long-chain fatty acid--CoA ligase [Pyrinomonadaceae bacterium]|nr:long-chain fatty acid--CoA ligase [Pyrinomonadaceae bacterium]
MTLDSWTLDFRLFMNRAPLFPDEPTTLSALILRAAKTRKRDDALNFKKDGVWLKISSDEMIERAENIALGLHDLGLKRGERIALMSANCPEWTIADAACQFAGIVNVPIYTTLNAQQVAYILRDSGAEFFILQNKKTLEFLREIEPELLRLKRLIFFDAENVNAENALSLDELEQIGRDVKSKNADLIDELISKVNANDTATLIYTSGTTGEPKGVMLSHANLVSNVLDTCEHYDFSSNDVPLSVLPLSHVYERTGMYLYLWHGMAIHFAESVDKAVENLREVRPTIFIGVPRIFEKVYARAKDLAEKGGGLKTKIFDWAIRIAKKHAEKTTNGKSVGLFLSIQHSIADKLIYSKLREVFGGRLRYCISGGAALSKEIQYIFTGANISIMQGYGMTETSPVIASNNPKFVRVGTVGKPIRQVTVQIAEDGEILVKGANVMQGYFNKPEAAKDAFTDDGFFKTGDIGELDADGFLKITDRKKELFKTSGGKYIAPAPIENQIAASRFVNQVVLIGNDRKFPAALIVPDFEQLRNYAKLKNLDVKSDADFCQNAQIVDLIQKQVDELTPDLSKYEKVKKIALLERELSIESGELTPTLKVKRRVVNEKYEKVIDKIYAEN